MMVKRKVKVKVEAEAEVKAEAEVEEKGKGKVEAEAEGEAVVEEKRKRTRKRRYKSVRVMAEMGILAGKAVWRGELHRVRYWQYLEARKTGGEGYLLVG
jgi:hypothetical protein